MSTPRRFEARYTEKDGRRYRLIVDAGLHFIRGNKKPYFSIVATEDVLDRDIWRNVSAGCLHEKIVEHFPELKPIVAMHLSDIDGEPMYALENGLYFAMGGTFLGERWLPMSNNVGQEATRDDRIATLMRHMRVDRPTAEALVCLGEEIVERMKSKQIGSASSPREHAAQFSEWVKCQRPIWKREAQKLIRDFELPVFGDSWQPVPEQEHMK
jgi:hypothetical protein